MREDLGSFRPASSGPASRIESGSSGLCDVVRRDPPQLHGLLRRARASCRAVGVARALGARPVGPADDRGHAAVQALLPGPGRAAGPAAHVRAALLPRSRHRRRRLHRPSPHLLPDDGQLLVRRLLQAGRGGDGLRALDRRVRAGARAHLGDGLRGRRPDRPRRRRARSLDRAGHPGEPDRGARRGQLLEGRADGPVRAVLGALLRPRRPLRLRPGRVQAGLRLRSLPGVLEPRLHGVRSRRRRQAHAAAGAEHRHRLRGGAPRDAAAGRGQPLRDRRDVARDPGAGAPLGPPLRRWRRCGALVPGALRSRARHDGDRDRRRDALQRGPRLRPAPDLAARRPARHAARARDAVPRSRPRGRDRVDGQRLPRARAAPRRRPPPARGRGGALRADPRDRLPAARRPDRPRPRGRARPACTRAMSSSCTTRTASRSS